MQNDPELDSEFMGWISSDFVKAAGLLIEASRAIRKQGFSKYPIFPMCSTVQSIGQMLVEKFRAGNKWNYYASFFEEFEQRGLITDNKTFKENYKDPDEHCCLFVIDRRFINFLFIPYPLDQCFA